MKKIKTDILVIGGGLAGLAASLEAKQSNNTVTVVSKSLVGRSGNTLVTGAAMASAQKNNSDSPENFYNDVMKSSQNINDRDMAAFFTKQSTSVIEKLSHYNVVFRKKGDRYITKRPPGHSVSRSFPVDISRVPYHNRGLSISLPLLNEAMKKNIDIINNTMVYKLLKNNGGIIGALAINKKDKEIIHFETNIIIMAAGGGGNIYSMTNNTRDVTGDSYSLALDAGAELRDMEYIQFYPTMMFEPLKVTISNPLFGEGAVLKNIDNYEFMKYYSSNGNMATRDSMALAVYSEIKAGRGNPDYVYVDCSSISNKTIDEKFLEFKKTMSKANIDVKRDYIPVTPASHFYLGGIRVYNNCETGIEGLLACGEAVWGVHGANRLSGNALTETVVFGGFAGKRAAEILHESKDLFEEKNKRNIVEEFIPKKGNNCFSEIKKQLRKIMWDNASVVRNEENLKKAEEEINILKGKIEDCAIADLVQNVGYYETKNLLLVSEMVIRGALSRRESRGAHFRQDYPQINNEYEGNYTFWKNKDIIKMEFQK